MVRRDPQGVDSSHRIVFRATQFYIVDFFYDGIQQCIILPGA